MNVSVYYVVALDASADKSRSPRQHELGKFFKRADAETHAARIGSGSRGWCDVRVEERSESSEAQHPTHAGVCA
jgi:hypothetical protein